MILSVPESFCFFCGVWTFHQNEICSVFLFIASKKKMSQRKRKESDIEATQKFWESFNNNIPIRYCSPFTDELLQNLATFHERCQNPGFIDQLKSEHNVTNLVGCNVCHFYKLETPFCKSFECKTFQHSTPIVAKVPFVISSSTFNFSMKKTTSKLKTE